VRTSLPNPALTKKRELNVKKRWRAVQNRWPSSIDQKKEQEL